MRFIISAEAGSLFDRVGRTFGSGFERALGAPVTFENVGDSSGVGGAEAGARSPRDGSTVLMCNKGAVTSHPHTAKSYQPTDFVPLCQVAEAPIAVAVGRNSPFRTLSQLFEAARQKPDTICYSTPNPYHTQRLAMAAFSAAHGVKFKFLVLPGGNPAAIQKTVEGTVDFAFLAAHNYVAAADAGDIRILGIAHAERLSFLPEVPTFREQGFDLVTAIWLGFFSLAGVPDARLMPLRQAARDAFGTPDTAAGIGKLKMVPAFLDHEAFGRTVAADTEFHRKALRQLGAI